MKTIPVSFLVAGLLLPAVCLAQPAPPSGKPPEGKEGPPRGPIRPFAEVWKEADTDGDGFISKEEFSSMPRIRNLPEEKRGNIFNRFDKNGDGKLGKDELEHFGRPREGQGRPMKRLWELDTDKSGGVSFEEFKAGEPFKKLPPEKQEAVFKKLDTDGDGFITPRDRPQPPFKRPDGPHPKRPGEGPGRGGEGGPPRLNLRLDLDGDKTLSFEEFRAGKAVKDLSEDEQEDRFEKLDRNGDLKLSAEDFPPRPPRDGEGPPDDGNDGPPPDDADRGGPPAPPKP